MNSQMHPLYAEVLKSLRTDAVQMVEEGHSLADLEREITEAEAEKSADALLALQEGFWKRPSPAGFPYREPNDWESISSRFPSADSHSKLKGNDGELADRLHGGWLGRVIGCMAGRPLERIGDGGPEVIKTTLKFVRSWPLVDYVNPIPEDAAPDSFPDNSFFTRKDKPPSTKGSFRGSDPDDDIHYALSGQEVLRRYGTEFTAAQAIQVMVELFPYSCWAAAGKNMFRTHVFGIPSPFTAVYGNPCRQSLGAMIRSDPWGWASPANPALAAKMAFRDAANSQTRNGIYSGIFFATLMADTLAHGDPVKAIDTAEKYVPPESRFAEMVRYMRAECTREGDWETINRHMQQKYGYESKQGNHSIPNGAIILLGLWKGGMDFTKTIGITVMSALDTDCTGATAGSIMGCALGARAIPRHWKDPIGDTLRCQMKTTTEMKISSIAGQMFEIARKNVRR